MNCPCQSGKNYGSCCGRFISHQELPEYAHQLMRSRYTAYVLGELDYLKETWHPADRPARLKLDDGVKWLKLDVLDFSEQGEQATVEFEARLLVAGQVDAMHEKSRFIREQGRWLYSKGETLTPSFTAWKPGRNETCPCGSGKKIKRCCAA